MQDRRRFIHTLGSASTLTLWPECLRAANPKRDPIDFAVVSDTHLGRKDSRTPARQWEQTAAELADAPARAFQLGFDLGEVAFARAVIGIGIERGDGFGVRHRVEIAEAADFANEQPPAVMNERRPVIRPRANRAYRGRFGYSGGG